MHLEPEQESILRGGSGEAMALAMKTLVAYSMRSARNGSCPSNPVFFMKLSLIYSIAAFIAFTTSSSR
jgi:hypothetical protein